MLLIMRIFGTIRSIMGHLTDIDHLERALRLLSARLDLARTEPIGLVVCGGSALIARGLLARTTRDVDVLALAGPDRSLQSPAPLPEFLIKAAQEVARDLGLGKDWINNGPSSGQGGLFQLGLPDGLARRMEEHRYGPRLTVYFIGRLDQIHFKLYAAVDQWDGTHLNDLRLLQPAEAEIEAAARWTMTHDVSEGSRLVLKEMVRTIGYGSVAERM